MICSEVELHQRGEGRGVQAVEHRKDYGTQDVRSGSIPASPILHPESE